MWRLSRTVPEDGAKLAEVSIMAHVCDRHDWPLLVGYSDPGVALSLAKCITKQWIILDKVMSKAVYNLALIS